MRPKHIKKLQSQSKRLQVRRIDKDQLVVHSASDEDAAYIVQVRFDDNGIVHAQCSCEWAQHQGIACCHVMAALDYLASLKGRKLSFWRSQQAAQRQKNRIFHLTGDGRPNREGVWITSRTA